MSEWSVHYFDPEQSKEVDSRPCASLVEAVSVAETYERQGHKVQYLISPSGKLAWPLRRREETI